MDAASILVMILCAGVVALLVWFEVNSRRNSRRIATQAPAPEDQKTRDDENESARSGKQKAA